MWRETIIGVLRGKGQPSGRHEGRFQKSKGDQLKVNQGRKVKQTQDNEFDEGYFIF